MLNLKNIPVIRTVYSFSRNLYYKVRDLKFPNKDVVLPCYGGLRLLVINPRRQKLIGRPIFLTGVWETDVTNFISSVVKPDMTVLDVGADIGYYTVIFAKFVGPKGRVFSFEPIPKAKEYLDKNIKLNGFGNVETLDFALFDRPGTVCLESPFTKSKINLLKKTLSIDDIMVEMKIFDEWHTLKRIGQIDLIKIDVEGAEYNILRGMQNTLQKYHPSLLIEVHPKQLRDFGASPSDILELLKPLGYLFQAIGEQVLDFSGGNIHIFCRYEEGSSKQ